MSERRAHGGTLDLTPVHIARLVLTDFRNYAALAVDLMPGPVVLTGDNGAGKTNLLEAISFLSPGRGLRRAVYEDIPRTGAAGGFAVHAEIASNFGPSTIGTGAGGAAGEAGRRVRINGATARSADDLLEWLRVLWLTPSMDTLFTGPAADRRRFIDRLVLAIDPGHGQRVLAYERAMRGRNRLLTEDARDARWFSAIEAQMAETGVAIAAARVELAGLMAGKVEQMPEGGPFPKADIALSGTLERQLGSKSAVDVEEAFRVALDAGRERDRSAGRTLEGPHRSDVVVRHRPKAMPAELCSTGEQKALLVGLVLAHARLCGEISGRVPILLLDEIAAHLDVARRAALFGILGDLGCQTFMTGTEPGLFSSLAGSAQFLIVSNGAVAAL